MPNIMSQEDFDKLIQKLESNELYQKSKSLHKGYQFRLFSDPATGNVITGQIVRKEDDNLLVEGLEGYDESTAKVVIYNFKEGILHSEGNEPAIQYPGHWEFWDMGVITKVVADGGDTEEYWKEGVPVRIETNLAERRKNGEII